MQSHQNAFQMPLLEIFCQIYYFILSPFLGYNFQIVIIEWSPHILFTSYSLILYNCMQVSQYQSLCLRFLPASLLVALLTSIPEVSACWVSMFDMPCMHMVTCQTLIHTQKKEGKGNVKGRRCTGKTFTSNYKLYSYGGKFNFHQPSQFDAFSYGSQVESKRKLEGYMQIPERK